jgi:hypothetical protein
MKLDIYISEQNKNELSFTIFIKNKDNPISIGTKLLVKKHIRYMYSDKTETGKFIVIVNNISIRKDDFDTNRMYIYTRIEEILEIESNYDYFEIEIGRPLTILPKDIIKVL